MAIHIINAIVLYSYMLNNELHTKQYNTEHALIIKAMYM